MADRVESFDISTPLGTLSSAPQTTALTMDEGRVDHIDITIPDGHAGLTGIAIFHSGQQVIPFKAGQWLRGNNQTIPFPLTRFPTGAKWTVRTYNADVFDHSHLIRVLITDVLPADQPAPVVPVVIVGEASPGELGESGQLGGEELELPELPPDEGLPVEPAPSTGPPGHEQIPQPPIPGKTRR